MSTQSLLPLTRRPGRSILPAVFLTLALLGCGGPEALQEELSTAALPLTADEMAKAKILRLGVWTDADLADWQSPDGTYGPSGAALRFVPRLDGLYTFTLTATVVGAQAPAYLPVKLFDGTGTPIDDANQNAVFTLSPRGNKLVYPLDAGKTYYLQPGPTATCTDGADFYESLVDVKAKVERAPTADDQPNRAADAHSALALGVAGSGRIDYLGDADYFRFTPEVTGRYAIVATGAAVVHGGGPKTGDTETGFFTDQGEAIPPGQDFDYARGVTCSSGCPLLAGRTYAVGVAAADNALKGLFCRWAEEAPTGNYTVAVERDPGADQLLEWSFASGAQGWTLYRLNGKAWGGVYRLTVAGSDPHLASPPNLDGMFLSTGEPGRFHHLRIRMKNATSATHGRVFFDTTASPGFNSLKSVSFAIRPNDPVFREYTIDLSQNPLWPKAPYDLPVAKHLRVRLVEGVGAGAVAIDFIRLEPDARRVQAERLTGSAGPTVRLQPTTDDNGGQQVGFIKNGAEIFTDSGYGLEGLRKIHARVSSATAGGTIEVIDAADAVVGLCRVPKTGNWTAWKTVTCDFAGSPFSFTRLRFRGAPTGYLFNLNWIQFSP